MPHFEDLLPVPGEAGAQCVECEARIFGTKLQRQFGVDVCDRCMDAHYELKYKLVTKTEAREEYLLGDGDLNGGGGSLRFIERKNKQNKVRGPVRQCAVAEG